MDLLRKIAQGCTQHYEKMLLTLALLGLGGAVWYLDQVRKTEDEKIKIFLKEVENRSTKSNIKPLDLAAYQEALKIAQNAPSLDFSLPHNLVNPVKWQKRPNNELIKVQTGREVGWEQMEIVKITPLNLTITLDQAPSPGNYFLGFTRDAAEKPIDRKKKRIFSSLNATNRYFDRFFVLREIKGPPENPTELILEMLDTNEKLSVAKEKAFVKVEGYEADLKYKLDGKTFNNLRVGTAVRFLGDEYNIVAISPSEVVVSARLNDKKFSVKKTAVAP